MPTDAQRRAKKNYEKKTCTKYMLHFHNVTDAELINYIEAEKTAGNSPTKAVRKLYAQKKEK